MHSPSHGSGTVNYIVLTWVPEEMLDEWNRWHNTIHIPQVLQAPQMHGARKFRVTDNSFGGAWQPQYATIYEVDTLADMEAYAAGPGVALRQDYADRYGAVGKIARMVLLEETQFDRE